MREDNKVVDTLVIVGNGFDRGHHLPTSYNCFKKYLKENYPINEGLSYPNIIDMPDGEIHSDLKSTASNFYNILEGLSNKGDWSDFENYLGEIDYSQFVERFSFDDVDDDEMFHLAYDNEDSASDWAIAFGDVSVLFTDWIESIDTSSVRVLKKYIKIFSRSAKILTFNYTGVLEDCYGLADEDICHIHGRIGEELIFGHCISEDAIEENLCYGNADITLNKIHESFYKNTQKCMSRHYDFFKDLYNVKDIYILGWKCSLEDVPYLKLIKEIVNTNKLRIHLTKYQMKNDIEVLERIKQVLSINNEQVKGCV